MNRPTGPRFGTRVVSLVALLALVVQLALPLVDLGSVAFAEESDPAVATEQTQPAADPAAQQTESAPPDAPPTVSATNIQVTAGPDGTATVSYDGYLSASDDVGVVDLTCDIPSGSVFSVGTTTVNCTASDAAGQTGTGSFQVVVDPAPAPTATQPAPAQPTEMTAPAAPTNAPAQLAATETTAPAVTATTEPAATSSAPTSRTVSGTPAITSDKADYAPGERVTLTGSNWQPGENVHIYVNDDFGASWSRNVDVTADADGDISDAFNLPDWFVADYIVRANGSVSGLVTTTFTDANVQIRLAGGPTSGTVSWERFSNTTCSGSPSATGSVTATTGFVNLTSNDTGQSLRITAPSPISSFTFSAWSQSSTSTTNPVCLAGSGAGVQNLTANYITQVSTNVSTVSGSGTYGGTATLTATLKSGTTPVSGKIISFKLNGTSVGSAITNSDGVASLSGVSLTGVNAGSTANAVEAAFSGDTSYSSSSATGTLTVNKAASTTTITCPASATYTGAALTPCTAVVTGAGGLNQTATVSYSNNTNAGTATANAAYAESANYLGSTDSETFEIGQAASTTTITCPASATYTGTAQTPCSATATGVGGLSQSLSVSYSDNTNAGTATATASYAGDANHTGSSDSETFTIGKASTTTSVACPASVTYTGSALTPCTATVTGAGGLNQTATVSYTDNTAAGTATASASYAESANYLGSSDSETFTIAQAASTTVVTCTAGPFVYTGAAQTPCSATVTGAGGLSQSLSVSYAGNVNAGTATASASYAGDANHTGSSDSTTFTIAKATPVITWANPAAIFYGTALSAIQLNATASVPGSFAYTPAAGTVLAVGTQTLSVSFTPTDTANYNGASKTVSLSVMKWTTGGFYSPVTMDGSKVNAVKGGSTVPLKFDVYAGPLGQNEQTDIAVITGFAAVKINCDTSDVLDQVDFVTTGNTALRYDTTSGQFVQNWKTPATLGCYRVTVTLQDGSSISADFKITK